MYGLDIDEDAEQGIDYINEENRRFNQRLKRAYSKSAAHIKESLERGTAV